MDSIYDRYEDKIVRMGRNLITMCEKNEIFPALPVSPGGPAAGQRPSQAQGSGKGSTIQGATCSEDV